MICYSRSHLLILFPLLTSIQSPCPPYYSSNIPKTPLFQYLWACCFLFLNCSSSGEACVHSLTSVRPSLATLSILPLFTPSPHYTHAHRLPNPFPWLIFLLSIWHHFHGWLVYWLSSPLWRHKIKDFFWFGVVHCCIPRTYNTSWHTVGIKHLLNKWMNTWIASWLRCPGLRIKSGVHYLTAVQT